MFYLSVISCFSETLEQRTKYTMSSSIEEYIIYLRGCFRRICQEVLERREWLRTRASAFSGNISHFSTAIQGPQGPWHGTCGCSTFWKYRNFGGGAEPFWLARFHTALFFFFLATILKKSTSLFLLFEPHHTNTTEGPMMKFRVIVSSSLLGLITTLTFSCQLTNFAWVFRKHWKHRSRAGGGGLSFIYLGWKHCFKCPFILSEVGFWHLYFYIHKGLSAFQLFYQQPQGFL